MAGAAPTTAFGQAVIGPPGSGKTTYCLGMSEFLRALGRRVAVVNLDPANEGLPYECAVDVGELVGLGDVMDALRLGPNGGLLYCMEYLEANLDWLRAKLEPLRGHYFLFDCPGQVELCTHHTSLRSIFSQMAQWDLRPSTWTTTLKSWTSPTCLTTWHPTLSSVTTDSSMRS
ncbi:ATP binding domain 1 family, member B (predicted) [Rattus norvegicus]|uniref:GPN-loop GTPase 2 n=1 Tax=Rattus norvegicus TaxID=10116 RepID=A6ISX8_RAT|nr:ATP binding domain 1 family, member B (predicted) [Rattus norvegicus]